MVYMDSPYARVPAFIVLVLYALRKMLRLLTAESMPHS